MKKTITFLLLIAATCTIKAQNYIPFPTSNTMWTQREGNGDTLPSYYCYGLTNEDTTINIIPYHKLFRSVDTVFSASECIGGLREDSMKHVYFFSYSTMTERLLFDFSLQPGDTVNTSPGPTGIVDYIDSANISGVYHKRFNFKTFSGTAWVFGSWIEGIGNASLGGLLNSAMAQPTCDCADNIICMKQNNLWVYHNPAIVSVNCLNDGLAVIDVIHGKPSVTIYPNPVTGSSQISVSAAGRLHIYNVTGMLMYSGAVNGNTNVVINKEQYPAGIYFYRLYDEAGNVASGKFAVE